MMTMMIPVESNSISELSDIVHTKWPRLRLIPSGSASTAATFERSGRIRVADQLLKTL